MGFFYCHILLIIFLMAYDEISKPITVTEANKLIKETLNESFYQIMIVGEISGYRPSSTGHWYFDLKDKDSSLSCAVFKTMQYGMPRIQNGDLVIATGRIDLYEKTGKLSFIITRMVRKGDGELQALIEKRKQYYQSLGWFDIERKKTLPTEIKKLGVVTSPTGAAIQDILNITKRRAPSLDIIIFPCAVQGEGAAMTIASRIRQANNFDACDVLIVGRGGGSQEDLACFSEDAVIEAIFESSIPVISAVGHEIDYPISDHVADLRAPTPSAAAELVTETIYTRKERLELINKDFALSFNKILQNAKDKLINISELNSIIEKKFLLASSKVPDAHSLSEALKRRTETAALALAMAEESIETSMHSTLENRKRSVQSADSDIQRLIEDRVTETISKLKDLKKDAKQAIEGRFTLSSMAVASLKKETEALSPLAILERGYAVVTDKNGKILKSAKSVKPGDEVITRLHKGEFISTVKEYK